MKKETHISIRKEQHDKLKKLAKKEKRSLRSMLDVMMAKWEECKNVENIS